MRYIHKPEPKSVMQGTKRVVGPKFLFFPKRIKDETRWLEMVSWEEERGTRMSAYKMGWWSPTAWL